MQSNFRDVGDFHQKFGLPAVNGDPGPREWNTELIEFRKKFLYEEWTEFYEGVDEQDHAKMADALVDLAWVAMGTAHLLGYPWQELWNEVVRANLAKKKVEPDGSDNSGKGRPLSQDIVKPPDWQPPDIEGILARHGF